MLFTSTIQLLRFHFSFFLLPVYLFALSGTAAIDTGNSILVFIILHLLVYPASNGYNSYMDRDTDSIGGVKHPLPPTRQLLWVTIGLDLLAVGLSFFISVYFALGMVAYIAASKAYSFRGIRLKQYPVAGYLTVVVFQGAVTYWLVQHGCSVTHTLHPYWPGMVAASLLIGGFYPLTQIYQHRQDEADGVTTLSLLLGYRGTFVFTAAVYALAMLTLLFHFYQSDGIHQFMILQAFFIPVLVYFFVWLVKVWKDTAAADFAHTMRMNLLASACTNSGFFTLLLLRLF